MKTIVWLAALAIAAVTPASAQSPFSAVDSINANNINASVLVHGDMWWNPETGQPKCEYPKGSGKHLQFAASVWMSGYDAGNQLHVAAQTYRQDGNDYWPGPLDAGGSLSYATSYQWAKIWKTTRNEINAHKANVYHTVANTPESILTWPGKNNVFAKGNGGVVLDVPAEMAPFVDLNGDGRYQPLKGDYPDIRGDQGLWYVFTDNGPSHSQTNGTPLGVEVRVLAYAYNRGTLIDNVVYYDYTILNKSANDYHDFLFALWDDVSIGYYGDDYIGFDSSRRLGICYNSNSNDGGIAGNPSNSYGFFSPMVGMTFVSLPGDAAPFYVSAGSFIYYNNDPSIIGVPVVDTEYNHYMRSRIRNGMHLKYDPDTVSSFVGTDRNYVFPDDPFIHGAWNECTFNTNPGDRRFVLASNDFELKSGDKKRVVMALVVVDSVGGCPDVSFARISPVADTAWGVFRNPPAPIFSDQVGGVASNVNVYPNPVHDKLVVENISGGSLERIQTIDLLGRQVHAPVPDASAYRCTIDIQSFIPGMYILRYCCAGQWGQQMFVKN